VLDLTPQQTAVLERLVAAGFAVVAFPLYGNAIAVRRGKCAALLVADLPKRGGDPEAGPPATAGSLKMQGPPCYVVEGNLGVAVFRGDRKYYVWKKKSVEATEARERELAEFALDLQRHLEAAGAQLA
jgi:hypothetical protein